VSRQFKQNTLNRITQHYTFAHNCLFLNGTIKSSQVLLKEVIGSKGKEEFRVNLSGQNCAVDISHLQFLERIPVEVRPWNFRNIERYMHLILWSDTYFAPRSQSRY
jgi:hypothetical protein